MSCLGSTLFQKVALLVILAASWSDAFQQPWSQTHSHFSTPRKVDRVHGNSFSYRHSNNVMSKSSSGITSATSISRGSSTSLEASSLLSTFSSPVGAFLVLTGIVLIHEAGHYLAARYYGMKVEEFSIGFGPKLIGFEALGNEFNFRAVPLGGYVRFPENYNITLVQEQQRELRNQFKEQRNKNKMESTTLAGNQQETTKSFGYQLANLLTLGALGRKHKQDEENALLKLQEETKKNSPWWKTAFGLKNDKPQTPPPYPPTKEIIYPDDVEIEYYDDPDLLQNRPWYQRAVVLSGGVIFNLLLAFFIYFGQITTLGLPQPVFDQGIVVSQNPAREAAASGFLRKGDIIMGVNGHTFAMTEKPTAAVSQKAISDFISVIRATPEGDSLQVSVIRQKGADPVDVTIQPRRLEANAPKTIGVMLSPNFIRTELMKVDNPVDAVVPAAKLVSSITKETASGLVMFFGQLITGQDTGGQQVSGPIGLIKTGSDVVSTKNWSTVFAFAAAISINLGVVNAFPLPALDGGQLVFVLAEAVSGRKIDQRLQEEIIGITVLLLIFVSASATLGDVQNLLLKN